MTTIECVMDGDRPIPIIAMYESYTGWYWYITEQDKEEPDILYGFVHGFEDEWGTVSKTELESNKLIWKVPKVNWFSNSRIVLVEEEEVNKLKCQS